MGSVSLPALQEAEGAIHRGRAVTFNRLALENRLNALALLPVDLPLRREEALAQDNAFSLLQPRAFHKVVRLRHQDFTHQVRMIEQKNGMAKEFEVSDIAVFARYSRQRADEV